MPLPDLQQVQLTKSALHSARLEGARLALIVAPPCREGHLCACCAKMRAMKPEEIVKP